jgi:hypothetical protein
MPLSICEFHENRLREGHAFLTSLNYIGTRTVHLYGIVERLCEDQAQRHGVLLYVIYVMRVGV